MCVGLEADLSFVSAKFDTYIRHQSGVYGVGRNTNLDITHMKYTKLEGSLEWRYISGSCDHFEDPR